MNVNSWQILSTIFLWIMNVVVILALISHVNFYFKDFNLRFWINIVRDILGIVLIPISITFIQNVSKTWPLFIAAIVAYILMSMIEYKLKSDFIIATTEKIDSSNIQLNNNTLDNVREITRHIEFKEKEKILQTKNQAVVFERTVFIKPCEKGKLKIMYGKWYPESANFPKIEFDKASEEFETKTVGKEIVKPDSQNENITVERHKK